ncbi:MFS transporter [Streptomyces mirabilis]|uniref:MFS transporter n=1 Tax=Streptomyces mirabilis TaxID=68239 RepID=UPI00338F265F
MKTGFAFVPMDLAVMVGASGSSALVPRIGPRIPIFIGLLLAAVGMVLLAQLELTSSYAANILPGLVIVGFGIGLAVASALSAATSGVGTEQSGVASAFVNVTQQLGGAIGIAVLSASPPPPHRTTSKAKLRPPPTKLPPGWRATPRCSGGPPASSQWGP